MANRTGGSYIRNVNELADAIREILAKTSYSYILTFSPKTLKGEGTYHKLKVRLKDVPKKTRTTHRPGYYEPRAFQGQAPDERKLRVAHQLFADSAGGAFPARIGAVSFRYEQNKALIPLLLEIDGPTLQQGRRASRLQAEVLAYAFDRKGRIHDLFGQGLDIDLRPIRKVLESTGLKFYGTLTLRPGDYTLRVIFVDAESGQSTLALQDLHVPNVDGDEPLPLPPMFPDTHGSWVLARESPAEDSASAEPFPFVVGEEPFLPALLPTLSTESSQMYIGVGSLAWEGAHAEAHVLDDAGNVVHTLPLDTSHHESMNMAGYEAWITQFEPGRLSPGEYQLVVRVTGGDGIVIETQPTRFVLQSR
jgi:hypothetical protein